MHLLLHGENRVGFLGILSESLLSFGGRLAQFANEGLSSFVVQGLPIEMA